MTIQDKALVLQEAQDLSGGAGAAYRFSNTINIQSINPAGTGVRDIGQGYPLWMEFEVTETFTGFTSLLQSPFLIMGVAVSTTSTPGTTGSDTSILATCGWPITNPVDGALLSAVGMMPSDSTNYAINLFEGDIFRCAIPSGVFGNPWFGTTSVRNAELMPAGGFISAAFITLNATAQSPNLKPTAFTAANFSAGAITSRIIIGDPVETGAHNYSPGMTVK